MTDPDSSTYLASIVGTWNPGSVPAITPDAYASANAAIQAATDAVIGVVDSTIEFHVIATDESGGPVYRTRWRLEADASGPSLNLNTTEPHQSELTLLVRVYPRSQVRQVIVDEEMHDMPYRGVYAPIIGALLLRHAWGPGSRALSLTGFGTGTFEPTALRYREAWNSVVTELPYDTDDDNVTTFAIVRSVNERVPAMWLVTEEDQRKAWQISFCVNEPGQGPNDRWDTPQSVPEFEPLPWPT